MPIERQRHRALWPIAWLQTAALVTFRPMHSIRRLGVPNRAGPAILFAITSIAISACILSIRSMWFSTLVYRWMAPDSTPTVRGTLLYDGEYSKLDAIGGWGVCAAAWAVMMLPIVPLGIAVANVVCRDRVAAFHTALRWSCYSSVVFVWFAIASLLKVAEVVQDMIENSRFLGLGLYSRFWTPWKPPEAGSLWSVTDLTPVAWPLILAYGAVLLIGLLCNPHRDPAQWATLTVGIVSYLVGCAVLSQTMPWWALSLPVM